MKDIEITYRVVSPLEEALVRTALMKYDEEFALHSQIRNYFLSGSSTAGLAVAAPVENPFKYLCLCPYSLYDATLFIHQWFGQTSYIDSLVDKVTEFKSIVKCSAFFTSDAEASARWVKMFDVTPGFVISHTAYDGVFSRTAPRFSGAVYEYNK